VVLAGVFGAGKNAKFAPSHHMFTSPHPDDIPLLSKNPLKVRGLQHDLVLNGYEVGGGSIRIHDPQIQQKVFDLIGFTDKQKQQFAHMLTAFTYGVPPHGGIHPERPRDGEHVPTHRPVDRPLGSHRGHVVSDVPGDLEVHRSQTNRTPDLAGDPRRSPHHPEDVALDPTGDQQVAGDHEQVTLDDALDDDVIAKGVQVLGDDVVGKHDHPRRDTETGQDERQRGQGGDEGEAEQTAGTRHGVRIRVAVGHRT